MVACLMFKLASGGARQQFPSSPSAFIDHSRPLEDKELCPMSREGITSA